MNKLLYIPIVFSVLLIGIEKTHAQGSISNLSTEDEYDAYRDSLMNTPYEWHLPIMGAKLRKLGFDLPSPNGIMVNYARSSQQLTISDLNVGFNPDNLTNVDGFARFNSVIADVNAVALRYDFWLLPFLNFYAVGGYISSTTNVSLGLPFELDFSVNSKGPTLGWGTVVAGGVGPFVMSADYTQAYTWVGDLDKPSVANVAGARIGHMFRFKKPYRNLVVLVGGQYLGINKASSGEVDLEGLIGITPEDKAKASEQLDAWYSELSNTEQEILSPVYEGLNGWLTNPDPQTLYYNFNKELYYPWSMSAGFNYQHNKRYQLTCMYSFLGSRNQLVVGLSYRFGWRGKNYLEGFTL